jgi:hypothetical protein
MAGLTFAPTQASTATKPPSGLPTAAVTHKATLPAARQTVRATATPAGSQRPPLATPVPPSRQKSSGTVPAETTREFAGTPRSCSPARKCADRGCRRSRLAAVTHPLSSVTAAFDGVGIALPDHKPAGNFDCGGFSYQALQLAANGFAPGDKVAVAGQALTLPAVASGHPDEIIARGQVIRLNSRAKPGAVLGFLGAGEFGTQSGTVTIRYAGGARQTATIRMADWYANVAAPGTVIAASALWHVPPALRKSFRPAPVSVYYTQVRLDQSRPIASVTMPDDPNMHFFDIGVTTPATYPTTASAANDTGLTPPSAASYGNFDGAGHSYNWVALARKGLRPAASILAQGVRFTWPGYGMGRPDNIRTQGQTIRISGQGRVLAFLGAATLGTQRGTVTIHYSDGSTQTTVLGLADWRAGKAADGGTIVATVPWNQAAGHRHQLVSVYSATVPLENGKTVVSVTLPVNIDMHIFAIAQGN